MAKINYSISSKVNTQTKKSEIHIRFIGGRGFVFRAKTGYAVNPTRFKDGCIVVPRFNNDECKELVSLKNNLESLTTHLVNLWLEVDKTTIVKDWLTVEVDKFRFPERHTPAPPPEIAPLNFFETFLHFLEIWKISDVRRKNYMVVFRSLQRFEKVQQVKAPKYKLSFESINVDDIRKFEKFMLTEHEAVIKYPKIYEAIPEKRRPQPRGLNTINVNMTKLRTFINWCMSESILTKNPFKGYVDTPAIYGTPYYLTLEELHKLYDYDFSQDPELCEQRDIFVFQCMIGCRVSDLYNFTKDSVVNGAIEYIARKTKEDRPVTVRVPLNTKASAILSKYSGLPDKKLLPLIFEQWYNIAIKKIFAEVGLTRIVTVLNQTTRIEEKRPLNEIASSHLARRTFIANLYNKVKDPNQVSKLSGHKEGSKAFARYREIDEAQNKQLVSLFD